MPISTMLDVKCPSVRLTGEIDMSLSYALLDEIRLLHDYYQFRTIELQIDSPGGSADALHYLVLSLRQWRTGEGRVLRTVGLNQVSSAAAMLLSFGTVGHRSALASSRLLYHQIRTEFSHGTIKTVAQLRVTSRLLEEWDAKFLDMLAEHISLDGRRKASIRRKLETLFQKDKFIDAHEALSYGLIDTVV